MTCHDVPWHDVTWCDMIWYDMRPFLIASWLMIRWLDRVMCNDFYDMIRMREDGNRERYFMLFSIECHLKSNILKQDLPKPSSSKPFPWCAVFFRKTGKVFFWDGETQSSSWLRPVPGIDGRWLVDGSEKTNGCLYTQYYLRDLRSIHKLFVYI